MGFDFLAFAGGVLEKVDDLSDFSCILLQKLEEFDFETKKKLFGEFLEIFPYLPKSSEEVDISSFRRLRKNLEISASELNQKTKEYLPELKEMVLRFVEEDAPAERVAEELLLNYQRKDEKEKALHLAVLLGSPALPWRDFTWAKNARDVIEDLIHQSDSEMSANLKWFHKLLSNLFNEKRISTITKTALAARTLSLAAKRGELDEESLFVALTIFRAIIEETPTPIAILLPIPPESF